MNSAVQQALEAGLLRAAETVEAQIDEKLQKLENLQEDDLERIRQRRIDEMKRYAVSMDVWDSQTESCTFSDAKWHPEGKSSQGLLS